MGIFKYICGYKIDKYESRYYQILLVEFNNVKDMINLDAEYRYKFHSHKYYPEIASDIDLKRATPVKIEHVLKFTDRNGYINNPFDSLKECAFYHRQLVKQEKENIRKEAFTRMVNYSQIPFDLWGMCYELAKNNDKIDFFMFRNRPCYRIGNGKEIYMIEDNSVAYYGDNYDDFTM